MRNLSASFASCGSIACRDLALAEESTNKRPPTNLSPAVVPGRTTRPHVALHHFAGWCTTANDSLYNAKTLMSDEMVGMNEESN